MQQRSRARARRGCQRHVLLHLVAATCALVANSSGAPGQPASVLAHTVHLWSVANLFQRAAFLAEVAPPAAARCSALRGVCVRAPMLRRPCALWRAGRAPQVCNKPQQAEELCRRALRLSEQHGDERQQVEARFELARFHHRCRGSLSLSLSLSLARSLSRSLARARALSLPLYCYSL